ncbi:copper chaperone PCu(A)C [Nocardioides sp. zg-ZUI104]|uniref:copper chaperone PCu(A)C n=1 Tax=Nocardioides faecalis TaxID=2803858 RepID=UPI001BCDC52F|nr:copper chaperone PCu(A)C [Nocardioides faecalis]MBS4753557.1 copper chaperone PCu(A)C [Nocardioides faecalis]
MTTTPRRMAGARKTLTTAALVAALVPALAACGTENDDKAGADTSSSPSATERSSTDGADGAAVLSVSDPWVKAADRGMTAAFGTLVNNGAEDVTVTDVASDVAARAELHETVENADGSVAMQAKDGGFVVPAGGTLELAPGGAHIMLMKLTRALEPGTTVTLTLTLDDGSTTEVESTVKPFDGADEKYQNGHDAGHTEDGGHGS